MSLDVFERPDDFFFYLRRYPSPYLRHIASTVWMIVGPVLFGFVMGAFINMILVQIKRLTSKYVLDTLLAIQSEDVDEFISDSNRRKKTIAN